MALQREIDSHQPVAFRRSTAFAVAIAATVFCLAVPARAQSQAPSAEAKPSPPAKAGPSAVKDSGPLPGFSFSAKGGPIDIKSDSLSVDYKAKSVVFAGHVHAIQSGSELTSDTLRVLYGDNFRDVQKVFADGDVKITQGGRWATSDHAVLDQTARTVEMTGNPVVHDGPDQITGTRVLIYLDSQKSVVEGARAVIFPHNKETRDNVSNHSFGPGY
jgi:lipopolysaccharide export system protein LptA